MFIAAAIKEAQLPEQYTLPVVLAGFLLLVAGGSVYWQMLRRVRATGGRIRSDLLGAPDVFVAVALVVVFCLLLLLQYFQPVTTPGPAVKPREVTGLDIIEGASLFVLMVAAILAMLIGRNVNLPEVFGLRRVGAFRGVAMAGGLIILMIPMFLIVTAIAYKMLDGNADQQEVVKIYQKAVKTGNGSIIWPVIFATVCVAPLTEEILFRGYIYPVFKRAIGTLPAALGAAVLFAAIHNNALGFPGLTLLALVLTLTYEFTGSLLVPVFMHAWFNGLSLFAMWWNVRQELVP